MSSTPLFDSIARRAETPAPVQRSADLPRTPNQSASPTPTSTPTPSLARATFTPAPTSPMSAPVRPSDSTLVPAALVAAIDEIPARVVAAGVEHAVSTDQLILVEAVADALTRAVVDAVVHELEQIARDGIVRA